LKIVFITPEEPFYLPTVFDHVLSNAPGEVVGTAIVSPIYRNTSWGGQAVRFVKAFGFWTFVRESLDYAYYKMRDTLSLVVPSKRFFSVKAAAKAHYCPIYMPENINAPAFRDDVLRGLEPDVIVSVSSPQIFGKKLIAIPPKGCINMHGSLLPHYRGVLPSFWMLAKGEKQAGVTVHYIDPKIDEGEIILQRAFDILPDDTLQSFIARSKRIGAELLIEALKQIRDDIVEPKPNPRDQGEYYSFPTRADVQEFRARGRRFR